jgi:hypothetical protein
MSSAESFGIALSEPAVEFSFEASTYQLDPAAADGAHLQAGEPLPHRQQRTKR